MASNNITRDHHRWTRDIAVPQNTEIDVTGDLTLDASGDIIADLTDSSGDSSLIIKGTSGIGSPNPDLILESYGDVGLSGTLQFRTKEKAGAGGDFVGMILFAGLDADDNTQEYVKIYGKVDVATNGQESGKLQFLLANHNGNDGIGFELTGGSQSAEIDAVIGLGSASLTTIAGNLDIDGDTITSAGGLELDLGGNLSLTGVNMRLDNDMAVIFGALGEKIVGDGTDLDIISSNDITLDASGDIILDATSGITHFYDAGDTDDAFKITVIGGTGATKLETVSAAADGHLFIVADGHVEFDGCAVGFDLVTPTYNASDTDVSFITGNKQFVTFGSGNITDLNLIFPKTSGNFVLLLKQDGTGSRTVTNYKAWDIVNSDAASGSATVKFAGGSNPDLTDDANHVDIISIFWDADNQIAYGVATLDFQF